MSAPPIFATLGCRLNAYESEAMAEMAEAAGLSRKHLYELIRRVEGEDAESAARAGDDDDSDA